MIDFVYNKCIKTNDSRAPSFPDINGSSVMYSQNQRDYINEYF
jgi:hypothetical protein